MNKFNCINPFLILSVILSICTMKTFCQDLTVNASGFKTDDGFAIVNLFRAADDIPKKAFRQVKANIINGQSQLTFEKLPYGSYAAILFHDVNANGILDHRFGPSEPMGFTNGWQLTWISGMPSFEKLKFEFHTAKSNIMIPITRQ
jgi:uncharacterized protein (DUF2141 family)